MPEQEGPFVASDEKTESGEPVGVEVAGGRATGESGRGSTSGGGPGGTTGGATGADRTAPTPKDAGPIDETGALDEEGETRRDEPRDLEREDEDLRPPVDRIDDTR